MALAKGTCVILSGGRLCGAAGPDGFTQRDSVIGRRSGPSATTRPDLSVSCGSVGDRRHPVQMMGREFFGNLSTLRSQPTRGVVRRCASIKIAHSVQQLHGIGLLLNQVDQRSVPCCHNRGHRLRVMQRPGETVVPQSSRLESLTKHSSTIRAELSIFRRTAMEQR